MSVFSSPSSAITVALVTNTPLSRTVAATYSASDISSYLVTVTATTGDKDGTTVASITATPGQTVTIDQLEEAKYSIVVTAFNAAKETIAGGKHPLKQKPVQLLKQSSQCHSIFCPR